MVGLSVMEAGTVFKPWNDKATGKTGLKMPSGKCATNYPGNVIGDPAKGAKRGEIEDLRRINRPPVG